MARHNKSGFRLNMDIGTPLHINIQGINNKIKTRLIGMEAWEYLIIKAPVGYTGIRNKMVEGNKVVVRFIQEGSIYGFEAYILAVIDKPTSLLVIDYPTKVEEKSLRKAERIDCYIPCTLEIENQESEGALVDISVGGCRCVAPNHHSKELSGPGVGSNVRIMFDSPAENWHFDLQGLLVNTAEFHTNALIGVKFNSDADNYVEHVQSLLDYLQ